MKLKYVRIIIAVFLFYMLSLFIRTYNSLEVWNVEINPNYQIAEPFRYYPINLNRHSQTSHIEYSIDSIVIVNPRKKANLTDKVDVYVSPIALCLRTLTHYNNYKETGSKADLNYFLKNAKWLVDNQADSGQWFFQHDYMFSNKLIKAPWASGLSQGLALSVLLRAYLITNDSSFIIATEKSLEVIEREINNGGVQTRLHEGIFIEEYPFEKPTHVLNGNLYAIIGLHETCQMSIEKGCNLYKDAILALENILHQYNVGFWSKYSLDKPNLRNHYNLASPWYQKLHIVQLEYLNTVNQNKKLNEYLRRFKDQNSGWFVWVIYPFYFAYQDLVTLNNFAKGLF